MSMVHVHVHGACPCPWCVSMSMVHAHVHGVCPCPWSISMSMNQIHVLGACQCPCSMSNSMLHVHFHASCNNCWIEKILILPDQYFSKFSDSGQNFAKSAKFRQKQRISLSRNCTIFETNLAKYEIKISRNFAYEIYHDHLSMNAHCVTYNGPRDLMYKSAPD